MEEMDNEIEELKAEWIENYAGTWVDPTGRVLIITIQDEYRARVTLLVDGAPMRRPWCRNKPAENLKARYNPMDGPGLEVALGRRGFSLELNYEFPKPWDPPDEPVALSVGICQYESDVAALQFHQLFYPLTRYGPTSTVGTPVARRPPCGPVRAVFPHTVLRTYSLPRSTTVAVRRALVDS